MTADAIVNGVHGSWSRVQIDWTDDAEAFKRQYWDLWKSFNPVRFQPKKWAHLANENGFRYLIYATRPAAPYAKGGWRFTGSKDGQTLYAFRLWDEGERDLLAQTIPVEAPESVTGVRHLATGAAVPFHATKDGLAIRLPETFRTNPCADGFAIVR